MKTRSPCENENLSNDAFIHNGATAQNAVMIEENTRKLDASVKKFKYLLISNLGKKEERNFVCE